VSIITLTTDYGTRDYYVAAMKGLILGLAPHARIVDVTHEIEPQNIAHGALVLWQTLPWFPPGTIHVVVVDPEVGTSRVIVAARLAGQMVIAPDNGLLTWALDDFPTEALHCIDAERVGAVNPSRTFHGRDIMAPAAGRLCQGLALEELGPRIEDVHRLPVALRGETTKYGLRGTIVHADRYGNLVTNIRGDQLERLAAGGRSITIAVDGQTIGVPRGTFADVPQGETLSYIGSSGLLEIAVNGGSARARFGFHGAMCVEARAPQSE